MKPRTLASLIALALVPLAGCGLSDPYAGDQGAPPIDGSDTPADTTDTHQHQHADTPDETTAGTTPVQVTQGTKGAERAARYFAATSLTYSPDTYIKQQRSLRSRSVGALHEELQPHIPDQDAAASLKANALTSRATVLVSDVETATDKAADVIVVLKVTTGAQGVREDTPTYQVYRVKARKTDGAWKIAALDAP